MGRPDLLEEAPLPSQGHPEMHKIGESILSTCKQASENLYIFLSVPKY